MKWIDTEKGLDETIAHLEQTTIFSLDTEADSLHSYFDKVCLVQISTPGENFILDPLAPGVDLRRLGGVLGDRAIHKVLHGADYDLRILQRDFGIFIHNLFDTMVAAQLLGYEAVGLAALLKRHFNADVDKSFQRANWAMRPLTPQMLHYAAMDTHYLLELSDKLKGELEALGRLDWALEELERLESIRFREIENDPEAYRKIKGSNRLEPRGLATLQRLHAWRDTIAREQDKPAFKIVGNELLLEVCAALPRQREALSKIRGFSSYVMQRYANAILAAVDEASRLLPEELPQQAAARAWKRDRILEKRVEKLKGIRDRVAKTLKIEPSILGTRNVLTAVASTLPRSLDELSAIPAMREWQKRVIGQEFVAAMEGETGTFELDER